VHKLGKKRFDGWNLFEERTLGQKTKTKLPKIEWL
jgi:hypothetical protein